MAGQAGRAVLPGAAPAACCTTREPGNGSSVDWPGPVWCLHPGHRAVLPDGFTGDQITGGPVRWSTGQPHASADAVLWAVGRVRPNTDWLPAEILDDEGSCA